MSQSTNPLSEAARLEATREATSYLEPEKDNQNVEPNDKSLETSSTVEIETEKKGATAEEAVAASSTPQASGDYPTGIKLVCILLALVLSVFLFSLDQVSYIVRCTRRGRVLPLTRRRADFRFRPSLQPPFQGLPTNSTASTISRGTARLSS